MKFLPLENIIYKTKLKPDEILKRMGEIVEPKKTFRLTGFFGNNDHKPYEGKIIGNTFSVMRIIGYRNSFIPTITGVVNKDLQGTNISVKMRLHQFVFIFMIFWIGIVGLFGAGMFISMINERKLEPLVLVPFGMLLFLFILVTGGFKYESNNSKKYFKELFEAEIEE